MPWHMYLEPNLEHHQDLLYNEAPLHITDSCIAEHQSRIALRVVRLILFRDQLELIHR
jgi:hypothetical protein